MKMTLDFIYPYLNLKGRKAEHDAPRQVDAADRERHGVPQPQEHRARRPRAEERPPPEVGRRQDLGLWPRAQAPVRSGLAHRDDGSLRFLN